VWGTYVHARFEQGAARRRVLDWARGGLAAREASQRWPDHRALRERAYDRIVDALAACLDPRVLRELGAS
jgi:cobyric acid synthase